MVRRRWRRRWNPVDNRDVFTDLQKQLTRLQRRVEQLETQEAGSWIWLQAPATSTSWDGDARSTTAKTLIDLSAVFSIPDYVKAVYVRAMIQDSGASGSDRSLLLGPTNSAAVGVGLRCPPADDRYAEASLIVPCDSNGDIYYQISASGIGTMDVHLQIWGYAV